MYMQRRTSGAAGNGMYTTTKYMRGAAGIGLGTTIKHLRRTTSGAAGNGLGATMKYLRSTSSAAANNGLSTTTTPPLVVLRFLKLTQSPTPGHVPRSVCVWGHGCGLKWVLCPAAGARASRMKVAVFIT
jgi:hypothetical protein